MDALAVASARFTPDERTSDAIAGGRSMTTRASASSESESGRTGTPAKSAGCAGAGAEAVTSG
jgi:hypothetical protein